MLGVLAEAVRGMSARCDDCGRVRCADDLEEGVDVREACACDRSPADFYEPGDPDAAAELMAFWSEVLG